MNMKQEKWDPLNTHSRRRDGVCLVMKRTWCFCEFAGGARSDLQPKILEEQLVQNVRRASYKCVRSAPGVIVAELEVTS